MLSDTKNMSYSNRKITQSRIESYQQLPFTTVDDVDDEIVNKGAKWLINDYSNKIKKFKNAKEFAPHTARLLNAKIKNSTPNSGGQNTKKVIFENQSGSQSARPINKKSLDNFKNNISKKKEKEMK